jgi:hypothetical protein
MDGFPRLDEAAPARLPLETFRYVIFFIGAR